MRMEKLWETPNISNTAQDLALTAMPVHKCTSAQALEHRGGHSQNDQNMSKWQAMASTMRCGVQLPESFEHTIASAGYAWTQSCSKAMPLRPLRSRGEERRGEERRGEERERERGRERETKKIQLYKIQGVHPKVEHGVTQTAHTCQHGVERPRCCPLQKDSATGIARIYRVKRTPTLPKQSLQIPRYTLQTDSDSDLYNIL